MSWPPERESDRSRPRSVFGPAHKKRLADRYAAASIGASGMGRHRTAAPAGKNGSHMEAGVAVVSARQWRWRANRPRRRRARQGVPRGVGHCCPTPRGLPERYRAPPINIEMCALVRRVKGRFVNLTGFPLESRPHSARWRFGAERLSRLALRRPGRFHHPGAQRRAGPVPGDLSQGFFSPNNIASWRRPRPTANTDLIAVCANRVSLISTYSGLSPFIVRPSSCRVPSLPKHSARAGSISLLIKSCDVLRR